MSQTIDAHRPTERRQWRIPTLLILLGLLPIAASLYRVAVMAGTPAASVTDPDELRFYTMPLPILMHVIFAPCFLILGALQFSPRLRQRRPNRHRTLGYIAAISGVLFSLSGVYMVLIYPSHSLANFGIDVGRIILGLALPVFLVLGIMRAIARDFVAHRKWMIRAYAIAATSGLQSLLIAIAIGINGGFDVHLADAMMWLGWGLGLVAAEIIIHKRSLGGRFRRTA